jgi:hypothetical protein
VYIAFFQTNIHLTENYTMSAGTSSRSREKKVTDEDFDGNDLRALIKSQFFEPKRTYGISYDSKELSFFFAKAYAEGEVLSGRDFKRKNYRTDKEFQNELRKRAIKMVSDEGLFKTKRLKIKRGIETMCNERGFLPREGWGGDVYDMLLTSIYYWRTRRILKFYKYDLTSQKYQFRTDYEYEKFSKRGKKVLNSEFPYLNLFLKFDGIHYEILQRKPETTDKDLADLLNTKEAGFFGWEKYFSRVKIDDDGLCYFNAVTKAVRLALKYEREDRDRDYPEGGGFRAQSHRTSSLQFQSAMVDLTGDSPKEGKGSSKKRKRMTVMDFVDDKYKDGSSSDEEPEVLVLPKDYSESDDVEIISAEQNEKNIRAKLEAKRAKERKTEREREREKRARAAERRMRDNRRRFSSVLKF